MLDNLTHVVWRDGLWLWLAISPWLLWVLQMLLGRSHEGEYADSHLLPWARASIVSRLELKRYWRHAVLALAWLLFAVAMAGPRIAITEVRQDRQHDTQVMVVLDVSRSMTARDVAPGRLERAKLELEDLIAREQRLRIGLVVYAARPHLMIPPTFDKSVLRHGLQAVRNSLLPTEGSNLPAAIEFAARHFDSDQAARVLLLVTDGEIPADDSASDAKLSDSVSLLAQQGIAVYALGIGTLEGAPIQTPEGDWLSYQNKAVVSSLQEDRLRNLTRLSNGHYTAVSDTDADWQKLYDQNIRYLHAAGSSPSDSDMTEWHELFGWFLVPAVLLLLLTCVEWQRGSARGITGVWFAGLLVSAVVPVPSAQAFSESWQQQAYHAYSNESYLEARQAYAKVTGFDGRMGEGSSAYRLGQFQEAVQLFTQAVLDAENDLQRARAVFNLANSRYQLGDFEAAAALYQEALRYDPADRASQLNLKFALAKIKQKTDDAKNGGDDAANRSGRGPRNARAVDGTEVGSGSSVSIDERDDAESPSVSIADIQPLSAAALLQQSRPAVEQATTFTDPSWQYEKTSPERIVRQATSLKVDNSILWKRIFESEEGFPAPVDTPRELPDMPPW